MDSWKNFIGKEIKIIYDDGGGYKKKQGVLLFETPTHIIIKIDGAEQGILLSKILRIEVLHGQ